MRCPNCWAENGYPLPGEKAVCAACGKEIPADGGAAPAAEPAAPQGYGTPTAAMAAAEAAAPAPLPPLVDVVKTGASGGIARGGLPRLLGVAAVAGAGIGLLWHFIGRFIDLVYIFPPVFGALLGLFLVSAVRKGRVRSLPAVALCALFAASVVALTRLTADSYRVPTVLLALSAMSDSEVEALAGPQGSFKGMNRMDPVTRLRNYLSLRARTGVTTRSTRSGSERTRFQGGGYWFFLAMTYGVAGAVAGVMAATAAKEPYCDPCDRWKLKTQLFRFDPSQLGQVLPLVRAQDWAALRRLPSTAAASNDKNHLDVVLHQCEGCQDAMVRVAGSGKTSLTGKISAESAAQAKATVSAPFLPADAPAAPA